MADDTEHAPHRQHRLPAVVDGLLDSPLAGLAPWIVLAVFEGPGSIAWVAAVALALSVVFVVLDLVRGRSLKLLGVVDVVFFAALLITHFSLSVDNQLWLETWIGEIANITLVLIAAGSMLARMPFTIQYAREQVDPQYWDSPVFLRTNYVITGVWALAFLVAAVAGWIGDAVLHDDDNLWTGWLIQVAAMVAAIKFSAWYPDRVRARVGDAAG
ncbi:hypothetical protein [Rhodococcus phenolicus]|uniref:hypothetical protein n=1 Tax=Rhodococcus phenolicus TaxID=263849 RepID=UPI000B18674F|nr:hypothetical protein [Rhodococcus phenolicus]